eukprot:168957-Pyramimonas_sp.AAC.1
MMSEGPFSETSRGKVAGAQRASSFASLCSLLLFPTQPSLGTLFHRFQWSMAALKHDDDADDDDDDDDDEDQPQAEAQAEADVGADVGADAADDDDVDDDAHDDDADTDA